MCRCPKCHRFGIEYIRNGFWECLWSGCGYITSNYEEILNAKHPIRFKSFIKTIKTKHTFWANPIIGTPKNPSEPYKGE